MKLEKFRVGKKKNVTKISVLITIIVLMAGIIIYESYALYEDKKTFNVLNGTVPEFGNITGEIQLAYTINGTSSDKPFPNRTDGYGAKSVVCDNGVQAEWNDVSWSLFVKNSNNNKQIKCTIDFIKTKIYGIERALASSASSWTRTNDAVGLVANAQFNSNAVQNDFDNIYPWSDIKSYNYNTSTREKIWIDQSGFDFNGSKGEVLTYIPEFYYKRSQDGEKEYISISKKELNGYTKSEVFSIGRYTMSGNTSGVHSKSGQLPFTNDTITNYRTYAHNLGEGFGQLDYHYFIIRLLYLVEYADYNSQTKLGLGNTNNSAILVSGGCNDLKMKSGTLNNDGKHSMIYRGMEDIYGNLIQWLDGINIKDRKAYICYDQSQYKVDTFTGCYKGVGYTNGSVSGFISKVGYDSSNPLIAFPIETNGTESTYIPDRYAQDLGNKICGIGSYYTGNTKPGLFFNICSIDSGTVNNVAGARLIKIN